MKLLENKTALITGATSGIGKAIALLFLEHGATVIGIGRNPEKGRALIEEASSENFTFSQCDVSSKQQVDQLFSSLPTLDILVNNAGITRDGLLIRMREEDWQTVIDTNLRSCFYTCQHACKKMIKAREGRIINVSSVVGLTGNAGQTNYAASKAGIIGFSKSLALEMASRNILINCIAPGFIETEMTEILGPDVLTSAIQSIPLKKMGQPQDIANTALFLASSMSNYITGQVFIVDGGLAI